MGFFAIIELILKLIGLWNEFGDYMDVKRKADIEKRRQERDKAIDDSKQAETDSEIWDTQDRITGRKP